MNRKLRLEDLEFLGGLGTSQNEPETRLEELAFLEDLGRQTAEAFRGLAFGGLWSV